MVPIITLLVTITISLLVTRIGAVALATTGLTKDVAHFQARSAFTGVGFTTGESEGLVNHPVRRRIVMILMFWGNIGIAAIIASTIASVGGTGGPPWYWKLIVLSAGIGVMTIVFTSSFVDGLIESAIIWSLKTFTHLDVRDYSSLLHLSSGYVVVELSVNQTDWIAGKSLREANLSSEGVLVLGLTRENGDYIGSPNGEMHIHSGDLLTLYGPEDRLNELDLRQQGDKGDKAHRIAVYVQKDVEESIPPE